MSVITSIEPQIKDKNRCNVYVDGRFYCGIKLEIAVANRLKAGMEIEKAELDRIQLETEKAQAVDKAMTHLSATMKTEKQMRDFLAKKGYTDLVADYVVERLKYYSLLDDELYCREYVGGVRGKGKKLIELELIKRGAKREAIESVLSAYEEDGNDASALLLKYLRGKEPNRENLYKGFKYLLSKGFSYDTAKEAIESLRGGEEF